MPASRARTNEVLDNLVEAGFYTSGQVHNARMNPARAIDHTNSTSPDWFLDWAFDEVQRLAQGKGQYVLTARTTVDLSLQRKADEALRSAIAKDGRAMRFSSGAMVVTETDGAVRAIVGGLDYGDSQFNRATKARRQPGSSFKVYVYATALENGYRPQTPVRDASRSCGNWHPQNYGGGHGSGARIPLWNALARSLNTVAAELSFAVGREKVIDMTKRLGIAGVRKTCSMALGDGGITLIEHAGGVATFANGGKLAKPYGILDITTSRGDLLYSRDRDEPPAPQVVTRQVAEQMNQMLYRVVEEGTGQAAALDFTRVAGKTGTSTGPKDAWFVGFTGKYVGVVWIGNDDNRPMGQVTGGHQAAPIWHNFMAVAHTDMNIPTIPGLEPHPVQVAERERLAAIKQSEIAAGITQPDESESRRAKVLPDKTRDALKALAQALRKAGNLPEPAPANTPANTPAGPPPTTPAGGTKPADRRADGAAPTGTSNTTGATVTAAGPAESTRQGASRGAR